jgi:hypothetical protein
MPTPTKLILKLPRNIDLDLEFIDPPTNAVLPLPDPKIAIPLVVDGKGNARWDGCGCGGGNCSC